MAALSKQALLTFILGARLHLAAAKPLAPVERELPYKLPDNIIYLNEWFPHGCGNGGVESVYGYQETLGAFLQVCGTRDGPGDDASIRDSWRPNGKKWRWQLFSSNDCAQQIAQGTDQNCFVVPKGQTAGVLIVTAE